MKTTLSAALALLALAVPGHAQQAGDATKGEQVFSRCRACHMIKAPDGTEIYKGGRTGPNLYGVIGRKIASEDGFRYGDGILKLAAAYPNAVWDVNSMKAYVTDPTGWLDAHSGDPRARSKMTFKLTKDQDDLIAYLVAQSPGAPAQPSETDGIPRP